VENSEETSLFRLIKTHFNNQVYGKNSKMSKFFVFNFTQNQREVLAGYRMLKTKRIACLALRLIFSCLRRLLKLTENRKKKPRYLIFMSVSGFPEK
jgi:hypothetical protein